jgi:hypothetical protein
MPASPTRSRAVTDSLRVVEDLVPLIEQPASRAVDALKAIFGAPVESVAKRSSREFEWRSAGVVLEEGKDGNVISVICEPANGFQPFKGRLSGDSDMPVDRREVRESLGEPTAGRTNPRRSLNRILGALGARSQPPEWDRYDTADRVIHFEYDAGRKVKRVTLTAMPAVQDK